MATDAELKARLMMRDEASRVMKQAEGNLLGSAKRVAAGFIAAHLSVQAFNRGIVGSVKEAAEAEKVTIRLERAGFRNVRAIQDQASAWQRYSGVADDVLSNQIAIVRAMGRTEEQAVKVVKAALDMSAALEIDLDTAVQSLSKSYTGLADRQLTLIDGIRGLTKEQLANGAAVDIVAGKYAGSSEAQGNTLAGSLNIVKRAVDDLKESIGFGLISVITGGEGKGSDIQALADAISGVATGIDKVVDAYGRLQESDNIFARIARSVISTPTQNIVDVVNKLNSRKDASGGGDFVGPMQSPSDLATASRLAAEELARAAYETRIFEQNLKRFNDADKVLFGLEDRMRTSRANLPSRGADTWPDGSSMFDPRRAVDPLTESIDSGFDRAARTADMFFDSLSRGFIDVLSSVFGGDGTNWLVNFSRGLVETGGNLVTGGLLGGIRAGGGNEAKSAFVRRQQARAISGELERTRIRGHVRL